jgi:hypothetical protein
LIVASFEIRFKADTERKKEQTEEGRRMRERKAFIRVSFGVVRIGLPLFLAVACLLPGTVPRWRVSRDNETVF